MCESCKLMCVCARMFVHKLEPFSMRSANKFIFEPFEFRLFTLPCSRWARCTLSKAICHRNTQGHKHTRAVEHCRQEAKNFFGEYK